MQEFIFKNLILILFVLFLISGFIKGFSYGFLKKVLSLGSIIITIVATKFFTPVVSVMLKNVTNVEATLSDLLYKTIIESSTYDQLNLEGIANVFNTGDITESLKNTLCNNIANAIINLVCGIVVFIVVLFLVRLAIKVLDIVDYIPVVGQFNKLLGGVLGVIEVVLFTMIIFTILRVFEAIPQVGTLSENIKASPVIGPLYENNLIYNFFSNLFSILKK